MLTLIVALTLATLLGKAIFAMIADRQGQTTRL